jgi:hypothetical protein
MTREQFLQIRDSCQRIRSIVRQMQILRVSHSKIVEEEIVKIMLLVQSEVGQLDTEK